MKNLKQKIITRELTIGSWITFSDPAIAEIMAKSGFDWLAIDMEHSSLSFNQAQQIIRVIDLCQVSPLVRVQENNPDLIKRFMDTGSHGVIVPHVNSKAEAEKAVNAVKYPPVGTRGVGLSRAQNYCMDFDAYYKWSQENSIVIVQVEHIEAVDNLESIMKVEGVDGFILGLYDLSGSLGCPGDFDHPKMKETLDYIINEATKKNFLMGQHVVDPRPELVKEKIKQGMTFIAFGVDFLFFGETIKSSMEQINSFK
jgi:2-keto-3-deoxy-L-rhamnonate aldolase RhmA